MFSLQFAVELSGLLGHTPPPAWQDVADKMKIPFDPELKYHPEFDGYTQGEMPSSASLIIIFTYLVFLWLSGRALRQQRKRLWVRFPGNTHTNEKCIYWMQL